MITFLIAASIAATASGGRDYQAVVAAENGWEAAEVSGNAQFLDGFLADDYQSVSADGKPYFKRDIIAGAVRRAQQHPGQIASKLDASSIIRIVGNTAIVQHHGHSQISIDLLQKRRGRWVAWYSQHTNLAARAVQMQ